MASLGAVHVRSPSFLPLRSFRNGLQFWSELGLDCTCKYSRVTYRKFVLKAMESDVDSGLRNDAVVIKSSEKDNAEKLLLHQNIVSKLHESIGSLPTGKLSGMNFTIGLCIVAAMLVVVVKGYTTKRSSDRRPGSVADLVRRGQLRSDRRGVSTPLKYEDPFNNPMVKVSKSNSTVEMCGKVYRLAPVTLTDELQTVHQKRRSRAYQWKRPTVFLKEGDPIPSDVDPDTVRWIPANHPFATTASDIDEGLAQTNVYQKHGVPFRIQAEHEALQRKLEALQNDQKLGKLVIDPAAARDFERPLKSHMKSENQVEHNISTPKSGSSASPSDHPSGNKPPPEELQNP
ncbi:hypothetical protein SASPL_133770 [Salvia splendens]|uniref:Protein MULTIPLE CHLOROPLAST DIVISION SITE 1 n=1 Tax=Salvia splendens TaxID=180675 RepID=A0A8X8X6A3_SALSN|nr:protein MULTIPLE CHLOROPLAST DIVISION SITE 1-like [Salvia splendens]KAG6406171.1 hypothetical protein SASPL_133770 [Salvia splendens]